MNNQEFLKKITESFQKFLVTGSNSTEKLKILHGAIAKDVYDKLNHFTGLSGRSERFDVAALGFRSGKESKIIGRYIDKKVDITIIDKATTEPVAGIAVKFIMQNYSQNSNNYFENMLGETANIRCKGIPYFQIFIIPDTMPHYDDHKQIKGWENFTDTNTHKYEILKQDNPECYFHTPNKMLIYVVHIPDLKEQITSRDDYVLAYSARGNLNIKETSMSYSALRDGHESVIVFNDYETFIDKICHTILAR